LLQLPTETADGEEIRNYIACIAGHGPIDLMSEVRNLAGPLNLVCLDGIRTEEVDLTKLKLLDRNAWEHAQAEEGGAVTRAVYCDCDHEKPPGWYRDATGKTRLRRKHWQVGKVDCLFDPLVFDSRAHHSIEVERSNWKYREACDEATIIQIRVVSLLELDDLTGQHGYRTAAFKTHQDAAIKIFGCLVNKLLNTAPDEIGLLMRASIDRQSVCNAGVDDSTTVPPCCNHDSSAPASMPTMPSPTDKVEVAELIVEVDD
jgi:hypothetical protein